jgi:hypothetical protein
MYSVSDQYKTAMKQPVQRFRMTGTAGDLSFSDENILSGSFHLTNQCSDDTNVYDWLCVYRGAQGHVHEDAFCTADTR